MAIVLLLALLVGSYPPPPPATITAVWLDEPLPALWVTWNRGCLYRDVGTKAVFISCLSGAKVYSIAPGDTLSIYDGDEWFHLLIGPAEVVTAPPFLRQRVYAPLINP